MSIVTSPTGIEPATFRLGILYAGFTLMVLNGLKYHLMLLQGGKGSITSVI
ncbi:hypothetical protein ACYSNR_04765 [Enterococcus sp. LJL128]